MFHHSLFNLMIIRFPKLFLIVLLLAPFGSMVSALPSSDISNYSLESFESWLPTLHRGRSEAKGAVEAESAITHSGERAARLTWDLTEAHDSKNNFVRFDFNRPLFGQPTSISVWVHADEKQRGLPLRLWINDASGETYIVTRRIENDGWGEVMFPLADIAPAWASGDKNRRLDPPLRLVGVGVELKDSTGTLVMDDVSVYATGRSRNFIATELVPEQPHAIGWGEAPSFRFVVTNAAQQEQIGLVALVSIVDAASGQQVGEQRLAVGRIGGSSHESLPFTPSLKAGVYDLRWQLSDADGQLPGAGGSIRAARMLADASALAHGEKERAYARHWALLGGIFWKATHDLDRVAKTGGVWERFGNTSQWKMLEREPGRIDLSLAVSEVERLDHAGMDLVYFNTVYNQPSFYRINQERFAPAYGRLHAEQARVFGDKVGVFELGNEDNGPTKFLYTEIARHGAAGVRSGSPDALIANSGTAQIDIGWLRMQAARGLFDRLDALITHPYSWSSPPETYGTLTQLEQVDQIIDELGGMKIQLTTEWGYPEKADQLKRAQWAPRHMAIAAAVGMWRHGLYSFDNHFGIYDNGRPFPMAASLNAHVTFTHAHRFAGWLEKSAEAWVAVYEKAGVPLVMAWSPVEKGVLRLQAGDFTGVPAVYDMYGNAQAIPSVTGDAIELTLSGSPIYIRNPGSRVLRMAYADSLGRAQERYRRLFTGSPLESVADWKTLAAMKPDDGQAVAALQRALMGWKPRTQGGAEQAVVAQALRWLSLALHLQAAELPPSSAPVSRGDQEYGRRVKRLAELVAGDLDQPSLRWVLHHWRQLRDERAMLEEWGQAKQSERLGMMETVYDRVFAALDEGASTLFFPLWAYAHAPSEEGKLVERIQFIPGKQVPVKVRLHSYSDKNYNAAVRLDLPAGWKCSPEEWRGAVYAATSQEVEFHVVAGVAGAKRFDTVLTVPGKPPVRVPHDDFAVLPPLEITVPVLSRLIPEGSLPLRLVNHGEEPITATLRIQDGLGTPSLAVAEVAELAPGAVRQIEVMLPATKRSPSFHEWRVIAEVDTNNRDAALRRFQVPLTLDYELSVRAAKPPALDGTLKGWEAAAPLHLDRQEYARGSFGASWSREDLSGVVYTMWDANFFYIAARVTDQLFNQELAGADTWNQDSVQFIVSSEAGPMTGFTLALTPKGPEVWNGRMRRAAVGARLHVQLNAGETVYAAAIPWSEIEGVRPAAGTALRFDVLLNDDDAIINRRFMERYGIAIAHDRKIDLLGWLRLSDSGGQAVQDRGPAETAAAASAVFQEDFEEYAADTIPNRWQATSHLQPIPQSKVRDLEGRQGSRALVLENKAGRRPHVFLNAVRPLERLEPDRRYRLNVWVKGGGADADTARLIGICSDPYGNEGYSYVGAWKPTEEWQQVTLLFKGPGGRLNLIIRNDRELTELRIDDITVEAVDR